MKTFIVNGIKEGLRLLVVFATFWAALAAVGTACYGLFWGATSLVGLFGKKQSEVAASEGESLGPVPVPVHDEAV